MSAPGIIAGGITGGAKAGGDSAISQQENTSAIKFGNPDSYPTAVQSNTALNPGEANANQGLQNAGEIEKRIGAPVAGAVTKSGEGTVSDSEALRNETHQAYSEAVQKTHDATLAAEQSLNAAASAATIDPQQYLHTMGTDDKVMTAIGMALSGIGSGLTGQPNLAMDLYNRNTDRAIAAQQKKFENLMTASAQSAGLLRTAQDRQAISANAYNLAVISTMSGNDTAIKGAVMNIKSQAAPEVAKQMMYENDLKKQSAHKAFAQDYINTNTSGDLRRTNLLFNMMAPISEKLNPGSTKPFAPSPQSPQERATPPAGSSGMDDGFSSDAASAVPRMGGVTQKRSYGGPSESPPAPGARDISPKSVPAPNAPKAEKQGFLDKLLDTWDAIDASGENSTGGAPIDKGFVRPALEKIRDWIK